MDNEVIELIIKDEKSAKDFLKSKRAISFMVWVTVSVGLYLLNMVAPDINLNADLLVDKGTVIVGILIAGYSAQDVFGTILEIVSVFKDERADEQTEE